MDKVILKTELLSWLRSLASRYRVIGPVSREDAPPEFHDIDSKTDIVLDNRSWAMSPREYLLPREELLFTAKGKGGEQTVSAPENSDNPVLLAGLKLCDAKAIQILDKVYLEGEFKDPYYAAKREKVTLLGNICTEARWSCFCTSVGGPLAWVEILDASITDIGDKFYITSRTEKGDALLSGANLLEPTEKDKRKAEEVWQALAATPMQPFAGKDLASLVNWEHPVWAEVAKRCLACGVCNYLCPSCSCFDIQDETVAVDCVERFRCRDTCQFSNFTKMGAGHNPRAAQLPRSRQRVMHKFSYQPEQIGTYGCSGCGRCIEACPVNIDVRQILASFLPDEEPTTEQKP